MDVGVLMPGSVVCGDDGVPDHGFGSGNCARRFGRVGGGDVKEDLFRVPVEE